MLFFPIEAVAVSTLVNVLELLDTPFKSYGGSCPCNFTQKYEDKGTESKEVSLM